MSDSPTTSSSRGLSWIEILVVVLIVMMPFALLLPAVDRARAAARRTQSRNNYLKQLGLAFHSYHDVHLVFPPGTVVPLKHAPRWGCTYLIVPYIESSPLYSNIDGNRLWDDVANQIFSARLMSCYLNPGESKVITDDGYPLSHYTMNSSIGCRNSSLRLLDLTGGSSNTWLTSEIPGNYRPWAEPVHWRELDSSLNSSMEGLGRPRGDGALLGLADGSVKDLSNETDVAVLRAFNGGLRLPASALRAISDRPVSTVMYFNEERLALHKEAEPSIARVGVA